jgi:L1 cell adhesion molecule like protein
MAYLGIDLGTSNSCVYASKDGGDAPPELVMSNMGGHLTPSVVAYTTGDEVLVGEPARQQQGANPLNTFIEFKRTIGRTYEQRALWNTARHWAYKLLRPTPEEADGAPRYAAMYAGDVLRLTATDLYSVLLTQLVALSTQQMRCEAPRHVVVTVPAHFDHAQRLATVQAVARVVPAECTVEAMNEPTAAMVAYLDLNAAALASKTVLVFDLGAGTLDVTCVRVEGDDCRIVGSEGAEVGGCNFDQRLLELAAAHYKTSTGKDLKTNKQRMVTVRESCERAKKTLTVAHETTLSVGEDIDPLRVTRSQFERVIAPELKQCAAAVQQLLHRTGVAAEDVPHVVLCGGSSRVPGVQRTVQAVFGDTATLLTDVNADECVAKGACLHALRRAPEAEQPRPPIRVVDVASHTIGIRVGRDQMLPLVRRGDPLPASKVQPLVPMRKEQRFVDIDIFQGDADTIDGNRCLGSARLQGLRDGHPSVTLRLEVDANGLIVIEARDDEDHHVSAELRMAQ